jgi:chromosome segregation ATPase|tara:strand:- start:177 stop:596 length:420 start_codon:yes stop_codon:yes gene_type:complete
MKDIITELKNEIQKWRLKLSSQIEENVRLKGFKAMVMEDPKKYVNWKQRCQDLENEMILIKGITVTNSPELREANKKIKELENRLAEVLSLDDDHQKLNGKLQMRITELEQENLELHADNKKVSKQVEDQLERARKAGL